jgi:hypothetical protein
MSSYRPAGLIAATALSLAIPMTLDAQMVVGGWLRQPTKTAPGRMTMTVEPCCGSGYKLTYRFAMGAQDAVMTVSSAFDGSEVPVLLNGKPSGETMTIKRLDDHHAFTVLKLNGEPFGTSKSTLSADGRTLTVLNEVTSAAGGSPVGKYTETWTRQ